MPASSQRRRFCWLTLAAISAIALLSNCGFAPRGSVSTTTDLGAIFVDAPRNVPIASLLRDELRNRELTLTDNRDQANILIRLTQENESQRILSVQSTGRVSEYELMHSVRLLVVQGENGEIARYDPSQSANTVSVQREYTYDDTGVLGKEDEADILRTEMRQELARNLLLRVIATASR